MKNKYKVTYISGQHDNGKNKTKSFDVLASSFSEAIETILATNMVKEKDIVAVKHRG